MYNEVINTSLFLSSSAFQHWNMHTMLQYAFSGPQ